MKTGFHSDSTASDPVVRVVYWKHGTFFPFTNWMPLSWVERVMQNEGAARWRIGR